MAVWTYDWIEQALIFFGTTSTGKYLLTGANTVKYSGLLAVFLPIASAAVTFIIGVIAIPEPSDLAIAVLNYAVASAFVTAIAKIQAELTQPFVADLIPYIQGAKDVIICSLSQAVSANDARQRLSRVLQTIGISDDQEDFIDALTPTELLTMLFYSAEWWPSFDDDILATISATCCGDYIDGDPVTPGSIQQCQASYYVVDMLAAAFQAVSDQAFGLWWGDLNPFNDKQEIRAWLAENLNIPIKVQERAADYNAFLVNVAEIVYNATWLLDGGIAVDPGFDDLADYITTNRVALVALIQAEADANDAYTALKADLDAWINANVAARYSADMIKALDALIKPVNPPYLLDLLFTQDSDLLLYAAADCADVGPLVFNQDDSHDLNVPLLVDSWNGTDREFQADGLNINTVFVADFTGFVNSAPGTQDITVDWDFWLTHVSDGFNTHNRWRYRIRATYQDTSTINYLGYASVDQNGSDRWVTTQAIVTDNNPANPVVGLQMYVDTGTAGVAVPTSAVWKFKNISAS